LPQECVPASVRTQAWVVFCKPTVQGADKVLEYLARYVHRVAFTNSRLVRVTDEHVTFRYQERRQQQWKTMTVTTEEFLRRFLQHVLPRGTHKVRYYGIWHPSQRALLRCVQWATLRTPIPTATADEGWFGSTDHESARDRKCPCCGEGTLRLVEMLTRQRAPP
jgi:hypothetical protein